MRLFENETIWIVGASSGIGRALAVALAQEGAKLILSARREDELDNLNNELGGEHFVLPFDVSDREDVERTVQTIKSKRISVDRALFMAAIYTPQTIQDMDLLVAEKMVSVNVLGCIYFANHVLKLMIEQCDEQSDEQSDETGAKACIKQIALCGSVAAYSGLPKGQPYSSTKAAVKNFAESLYSEVPSFIDVKLISPGFVRTRITDLNEFDMPYIMDADKAAERILKGLQSRSFEVHFPKRLSWQLKILALLPQGLSRLLTRKFMGV